MAQGEAASRRGTTGVGLHQELRTDRVADRGAAGCAHRPRHALDLFARAVRRLALGRRVVPFPQRLLEQPRPPLESLVSAGLVHRILSAAPDPAVDPMAALGRQHAALSPDQRRAPHRQRAAALAPAGQARREARVDRRPDLRRAPHERRVGRVDLRVQEHPRARAGTPRHEHVDRLRAEPSLCAIIVSPRALRRVDALQNHHGDVSLRDAALRLVEARPRPQRRSARRRALCPHFPGARRSYAPDRCRLPAPHSRKPRGDFDWRSRCHGSPSPAPRFRFTSRKSSCRWSSCPSTRSGRESAVAAANPALAAACRRHRLALDQAQELGPPRALRPRIFPHQHRAVFGTGRHFPT